MQNKGEHIEEVLKKIAPGTPIRDGLENILHAKTGALLLITDNENVVSQVVDGGFYINEDYTSAKLYELAKMDGAIVLSGDFKKILFANAQLIPSYNIPTVETGTRHRTAERTAKQTGEVVISISQRRNIITIFQGNERYILENTDVVLNKANQAIQTLERYKKVFDNKLGILNEYEFNDIVTLDNVLTVIQRAEMLMQELIGGVEKEEQLIIKDYIVISNKKRKDIEMEKIIKELSELTYEELTNLQSIAKIFKYEFLESYEDVAVYPKGYRILNKVPRMPNNIVENLVKSFKSFQHILAAEIQTLDDVEGIGEVRAKNIKQSLQRMQEQFVFENISV